MCREIIGECKVDKSGNRIIDTFLDMNPEKKRSDKEREKLGIEKIDLDF